MCEKLDDAVKNKMAVGEIICRAMRKAEDASATSGYSEKPEPDVTNSEVSHDIEQFEKKRKTRRKKAKRKAPYNKTTEVRGKKSMSSSYQQPVAPYNSNQFLIEDHNDLQDFDVNLMAVSAANSGAETHRTGRVRDASFTSAESDQEFYSSPEDEEEFLTKEFSNTYQDLHVESLAAMTKSDLIQTVLQLEEKIDNLEKRIGVMNHGEETPQPPSEKFFESEICKFVHESEELVSENEQLCKQTITIDESSEDSESDSSSSSETSEMTDSETEVEMQYQHMNGDVNSETDVKMESDNVT